MPMNPAAGREAGRVERSEVFGRIILLALVLLIMGLGYGPPDDALRHVAYAVSGESWENLLVLRDGIYEGFDSHPGWHLGLRVVHAVFGVPVEGLLAVSVCVVFWGLAGALFFAVPSVAVLAGALGLAWFLEPESVVRFFLGRPLLFTTAVVFLVASQANSLGRDSFWKRRAILLGLAVGFAVGCHSAWYLHFLSLPVLFAGGGWKALWRGGLAILGGILGGAFLTGHPQDYLGYQLQHLWWSLFEGDKWTGVVGEFEPLRMLPPMAWAGLCGMLLTARADGRWRWSGIYREPFSVLFLLTLGAGFGVGRFWHDFGFPASLVVVGRGLMALPRFGFPRPPRLLRWMGVLRVAIPLFVVFMVLVQGNAFWRQNAAGELRKLLRGNEMAGIVVPAKNGVAYGNDLRVFFFLFYSFPEGDWKYAPGFEPALMPETEQAIYYGYRERGEVAALEPWVEQLGTGDRLFVMGEDGPKAALAFDERGRWIRVTSWLWVFRSL